MSKPEYQGPPEQHYNQQEARKYTTSSRIRKVQYELAQRAYELLELDENNGKQKDSNLVLLDIGCGSGLSGEILKENGHHWVGVDISRPMLDIARDEDECDSADLLQLDMGSGLPFRSGTFDGAISISAIQWLCHSNSKVEQPRRRLLRFFQSLFACLSRSARAVFQFYPNNQQQCELITQQALRAGFQGGLVVDRPDSPKQRKVFLVLSAGKEAAITHQPPLLARSKFNGEEGNEGRRKQHIQMTGRNRSGKDANLKKNDTTRNKTIDKKLKKLERRRRKGTTK